jgi:hypothetical protein
MGSRGIFIQTRIIFFHCIIFIQCNQAASSESTISGGKLRGRDQSDLIAAAGPSEQATPPLDYSASPLDPQAPLGLKTALRGRGRKKTRFHVLILKLLFSREVVI